MTILSIRSYRRYATRLPVKLGKRSARGASGLMIELSQEGARISNLGKVQLQVGDPVAVAIGDGPALPALIRWAHDGLAGIRFESALTLGEMSRILSSMGDRTAPEPRYGT